MTSKQGHCHDDVEVKHLHKIYNLEVKQCQIQCSWWSHKCPYWEQTRLDETPHKQVLHQHMMVWLHTIKYVRKVSLDTHLRYTIFPKNNCCYWCICLENTRWEHMYWKVMFAVSKPQSNFFRYPLADEAVAKWWTIAPVSKQNVANLLQYSFYKPQAGTPIVLLSALGKKEHTYQWLHFFSKKGQHLVV